MGDKRRIVLYLAASLDGFIARRDGGVDWLPAGDLDAYGYYQFLGSVDTVVMGRKTYEQLFALGPYPYEGKKGYVLSTTRSGRDEHVEFVGLPVKELAERLRKESGKDIWLVGGASLAQQFLAADEVDLMVLTIAPRLLGAGIPLFADVDRKLELRESRTFRDGLVQLTYHAKG